MAFDSPLWGVALGGAIALLSGVLVARRTEQHETRKLLLSKLQELHLAVDSHLAVHTEKYTGTMAYLVQGIPVKPSDEGGPSALATVHALAALYFPEMDAEYQQLDANVNEYVPIMLDALLKRPSQVEQQREHAKRLTASATRVHRSYRAVQAKAVEIARGLTGKRSAMRGRGSSRDRPWPS